MHEDKLCVGIDLAQSVKREDVIGAFENPAPGFAPLVLQMLQKSFVKAIGVEMPGAVEPAPIARNMVSRVKAQAGKDMRRNFRAFLRR